MEIDTKHSIMFEDIARNLQPAKDLGIISVLIKRDIPLRNSKYKIDKLLGNECYSSKKIQSIGFRFEKKLILTLVV